MPELNGKVDTMMGSETVRANIKCKKIVEYACAPSNLGDSVMDIGLQSGFQNIQPILVNKEAEAHSNMVKVSLETPNPSLSSSHFLGSDIDGPHIIPLISTQSTEELDFLDTISFTSTWPVVDLVFLNGSDSKSPLFKGGKSGINRIRSPRIENLESLKEPSVFRCRKRRGGSIDKEDSNRNRKVRRLKCLGFSSISGSY
ncbi:hypothetical protein Q3G72_001801 [Acer saccharum]|nr:hypothetical protein Q3G72_001801 [Acer saccharum]